VRDASGASTMEDDSLQQLERALLHQQQSVIRRPSVPQSPVLVWPGSPVRASWSAGQSGRPGSPSRACLLSSPLLRPSPLLRRPHSCQLEDNFSLDEEGPLTVVQAIFNLANIIVGAGVLSIPYAFKQSGYFTIVIILVVIFITDLTGKWIGSALRLAGNTKGAEAIPQSARDFAFLAETAFGSRGRRFITFVTVLEVWFACVTLLTMNGNNAKTIWPSLAPAVSVPITGALATVSSLIPETTFAYLSLASSLSLLLAVVAMIAATCMLSEWAEPYARLDSDALIHVRNIPQSVGIVMFCFAGHPCFPAIYGSMRETKRWDFAVDATFLVAFLFYATVGFVGYVVFGAGLDETVTRNLAGIPGELALWCQDIAALGFLVKVQLTVPLMLNALMVACWPPALGQPEWPPRRLLLLALLGTATSFVAVALRDSVAVVAGFTGSFCVMMTSVLFPAAAHLALSCSGGSRRPACLTYAGVICFGCVMAVLGTASAAWDLLA